MKRKVALLSALLLTAVAGFTGNIFGDANGDGRVDMADVVAVVNAAMGRAPENFDEAMADINGNGKIDEEDASLLAESLFNPPFDPSKALEDDYERAFTQGYLPMKYSARYRKQQITSQEFKALLKLLIKKYSPDKMDYFNDQITDYDMPVKRNMAIGMAYYTARCIGAEQKNGDFEYFDEIPDLWSGTDDESLELVLPNYASGGEENAPEDLWFRIFGGIMTAYMWNNEHESFYSGKEVIAFDPETYSFRNNDPFTWEEAVAAITRLSDSFKPEPVYADISDERLVTPDATIITPELLASAAKKEVKKMDDLPRLIGFCIGTGSHHFNYDYRLDYRPSDLKEYAEWGFNSVKYGLDFEHLFTKDLQANLTVFKALDEMIAVSMENDMHFCLSMTGLPGCYSRIAEYAQDAYVSDYDILNSEKRQQAAAIWRAIAIRYKDVPNRNLSFIVIQDYGMLYAGSNASENDFSNLPDYTADEILGYQDMLIDAVREVSPDRFLFIDAVPDGSGNDPHAGQSLVEGVQYLNEHVTSRYNNIRLFFNFQETAYGYFQMNDGDGNADFATHSNWVPSYPTYIYAATKGIGTYSGNKLTLDGFLPAGTKFQMYLDETEAGTLTFAVDGQEAYSETFTEPQKFNVGYKVSHFHPFAQSDKMVEVALTKEVSQIVIEFSAGSLTWSGMNVVLPDEYAVERWRKDSEWDIDLGILAPEDYHGEFYKKRTSTVEICPNIFSDDGTGTHFTINSNVSFTSDAVWEKSDRNNIEEFVGAVAAAFPKCSFRMEDIGVAQYEGNADYWNDCADVFQQNKADIWYSALNNMEVERKHLAQFHLAGYEGEAYKGHHNFNVKLLKVLQKYMDK